MKKFNEFILITENGDNKLIELSKKWNKEFFDIFKKYENYKDIALAFHLLKEEVESYILENNISDDNFNLYINQLSDIISTYGKLDELINLTRNYKFL